MIDPELVCIGSAMNARRTDVKTMFADVRSEDFEFPSTAVLFETVSSLVNAGHPYGPQAVLAELVATGRASDTVRKALLDANDTQASGLEPELRYYAGAVVDMSYRRRYDTHGKAMSEAAGSMARADLFPLLQREGVAAREHLARLVALLGEEVAA